jgi:hypothetical protein
MHAEVYTRRHSDSPTRKSVRMFRQTLTVSNAKLTHLAIPLYVYTLLRVRVG